MDSILVIGLNHATAPIELREQVHGALSDGIQLLNTLPNEIFSERAIVSTCNRTEIYAVTPAPARAESLLRAALAECALITATHLDNHLFVYSEQAAVEHLFAVASGIDSMIIGEFEILHQVREAYELAHAAKHAGAVLSRLFLNAIHTGKRARAETAIGEHAVSIAYAAVELAKRAVPNLAANQILLVGAGEMGTRVAKNLKAKGATTLTIANRNYDAALTLARELRGRASHFDALEASLTDADIVICATASPQVIVTETLVTRAMNLRRERPLCLIDIALPRNIAPEVARIPNVQLVNLDDLHNLIEFNRTARASEIAGIQEIIREEADAFRRWLLERRAAPVLSELYSRAEIIRRAELDKMARRQPKLTELQRQELDAATRSILKKLLAAPTQQLKVRLHSGDGELYLTALRELFGLQDEHTDL
jgi:glutamyl-tRNA reductase